MRLPTLGLGLLISDSISYLPAAERVLTGVPSLFPVPPSSFPFSSCTLVECLCAVLFPSFITTISIPVSPATLVAVITISFLLLLPSCCLRGLSNWKNNAFLYIMYLLCLLDALGRKVYCT